MYRFEKIIGAKFICCKCDEEFWHFWAPAPIEFAGSGSACGCKFCDHSYVKNLYFRPKCAIIFKILRIFKNIFWGYIKMTSTAIEVMEYSLKDGRPNLEITFKSGTKYRYIDVPLSIFNGFANADSRGRFFQNNIRGQFKYEKLA